MIIELNARRNYTERFLAKKKISKEDKGTARRREEERSCFDIPASLTHLVPARVLPARLRRISRFSISSSSPTPSHACAYTFTSTANVPTHFSPLPTETLALPSIFFSFFLFEIHSFPFVFLSIQNYSIFIYI